MRIFMAALLTLVILGFSVGVKAGKKKNADDKENNTYISIVHNPKEFKDNSPQSSEDIDSQASKKKKSKVALRDNQLQQPRKPSRENGEEASSKISTIHQSMNDQKHKPLKRKSEENNQEERVKGKKKKETHFSATVDISFLEEQLQVIRKQIHFMHEQQPSNWRSLLKTYKDFQSLEYSKKQWQQLAEKWQVYHWPLQKGAQEALGGYLFFPTKLLKWEDQGCREDVCERSHHRRIDTLWSLALAAKLNHSLAKLHLVETFHHIWLEDHWTGFKKSPIYEEPFVQALQELYQCKDNPETYYALGCSLRNIPIDVIKEAIEFEKENIDVSKESLRLFSEGAEKGDLRSQYEVLASQDSLPSITEKYLVLARKGYKPAFLKAALKMQSLNQLKVLEEGVSNDYAPLLINLANYHKDSNIERVREYYQQAAEKGISRAYIYLGIMHVGEIVNESLKKNATQEDISQAETYFTKAGEAHNPEGWDYLAKLYMNFYKKKYQQGEKASVDEDKKEKDKRKIFETLKKGMFLGSTRAYNWMRSVPLEDSERQELLKQYGPAPQDGLWKEIQTFLKE